MKTLAEIILILGLIYSIYAVYANQKWKNFQRFLKPGDPVWYKKDGKKIITLVSDVFDGYDYVDLLTINGITTLPINEINPIFFYNYKP